MEQTTNTQVEATTDEPAFPASASLQGLIADALAAGRDIRGGRRQRADGWTPDRIRAFLEVLSRRGVVADAARAAGISPKNAYALRNSAKGHAFDTAWRAALALARRRAADQVASRMLHGRIKPVMRDGKLWGELHRPDNRYTMSALTRLDKLVRSSGEFDQATRLVAENFDAFVDQLCGGDGGSSDFAARGADNDIGATTSAVTSRIEAGSDEPSNSLPLPPDRVTNGTRELRYLYDVFLRWSQRC